MAPDVESIATKLRQQLAAGLADDGWLRTPGWRAAVEGVPRHEFVRCFYRETDAPGLTTWTPVTAGIVGVEEWLRQAYADETLVTQFDGQEIDWSDPRPIQGAHPTSSSTLPALVVHMLEELQVHDGMSVMEVGTGTGYSAALMCHRLGPERVTSVETDPDVAARARAALGRCGYAPRLIVGDGMAGAPGGAPYDRTIATCGVRHVPCTWVRQTRSGGLVLATLRGWMRSLGLVRLTVDREGCAEGRFIDGDASFMIARQQDAPGNLGVIPAPDDGTPRSTRYGPDTLTTAGSGFMAQLAMPGARFFSMPADDGTPCTYVLDATDASFAVLTPKGDDAWNVRQGGPVALWDMLENALDTWRAADSPMPTEFGVTVTEKSQWAWLGAPDGPSWRLPTTSPSGVRGQPRGAVRTPAR
ncbi:ATP-grasp peptide maturase system methyltransferase [Streptomyces mobaraensis NBRC 13819 = DSM 40847]|uniref:Protein-L-isoaspartate O-methyltransferase n=1 Tax=Streptomyces mobaraensis (strain ATCC 29032 / DSM 40847 / JCM 4168 / NBRC 13819 / NCIMB 11159 / IPCR 16-22) TaxID=1223523 RepID=M3C7V1_STRM1|nr:ATP-grasp peptide maturase system methyltransferase [Streptomyces mobaraensis]EMF00012.1 O-methyltransferase [Streptomyces mobaraensis NBRC 13819 = DSM 40847]QTT75338.1 ATP-grasp peptide maturase system methyltransferase [Streptomyces mobaraensis NBRC 13819 = DSM 40847]